MERLKRRRVRGSGKPGIGYREGIYGSYEHALGGSFPTSISALTPRKYHLLSLIHNHFPADKNSKILEIGCGHGALIHFARESGYMNIEGVDASPGQVNAARNMGIMGVRLGDAMTALKKCEKESLDAVVAFDVLEHYTKDEAWELAGEIFRVLRKDGRWIIHTPNADSPFGIGVRYGDFTHESAYTSNSISQLVHAVGFTIVVSHEDPPVVHGLVSAVRRLVWSVIRINMGFIIGVETGNVRQKYILTRNLIAVALR